MIPDMITASPRISAASFLARLQGKAKILAAARAENILRARTRDPQRWRKARLLWPLFTNFTKG